MAQVYTITRARVSELLRLPIGFDSEEFKQFVAEAQEFDFAPLVGEDFYHEFLEKAGKNDAEFDKVWLPLNYTYETDRKGSHSGLELVIAYFAFARYCLTGSSVPTSHGLVTKKTPHSEPLSLSEKKNLYFTNRQSANKVFDRVALYMDRKDIKYKDAGHCGPGSVGGNDIITDAPGW